MANLTSTKALASSRRTGQLSANVTYTDAVTLTVAAADLTLNALHAMLPIPAGATVIGAGLQASDLDTNGTPLITMSLGDAGSSARLIAATAIGQAGGQTQTLAAAGIMYKYTVDTMVNVTITAAAATGAAGTITAYVTYYFS